MSNDPDNLHQSADRDGGVGVAGGHPLACARVSGRGDHSGGQRRRWGVVPEGEREELAATLGARLREVRMVTGGTWVWPSVRRPGLSIRAAADEIGVSPSMLGDLERGRRRPRRSLLHSVAAVYRPGDVDGFTAELVELAGASLRPESATSEDRRRRRVRAAGLRRFHRARAVVELEEAARELVDQSVTFTTLDVVNAGCAPGASMAAADAAEMALRRATQAFAGADQLRHRALLLRRVLYRRDPDAGREHHNLYVRSWRR